MTASLTSDILPAGPDGVLVRFALRPDPVAMTAAQVLARSLQDHPPAGVVEIAPGLVSVLLRFDPARTDRARLTARLRPQASAIAADPPPQPAPLRRWTIPAVFGGQHGPQLSEVARMAGIDEQQAIQTICGSDLNVLTIGFAPGQPYIGLLPQAWDIPRMSELNPRVPAGAVVVAVRQIVMFSAESATGWRQVAQSAFRNFDPDRNTPMPLLAGDAIRYTPVTADRLRELAAAPDGLGGATLEVLA